MGVQCWPEPQKKQLVGHTQTLDWRTVISYKVSIQEVETDLNHVTFHAELLLLCFIQTRSKDYYVSVSMY